jgi:hypothetical protein
VIIAAGVQAAIAGMRFVANAGLAFNKGGTMLRMGCRIAGSLYKDIEFEFCYDASLNIPVRRQSLADLS